MKNIKGLPVVERLRICPSMQRMWVQELGIPHAKMQLSPSAPTEGSHVPQLRPKAAKTLSLFQNRTFVLLRFIRHCDLTYMGSCKNKNSNTKNFATTSHTPSPFSIEKA